MPSALPTGDPVPEDGSLPARALAELGNRSFSVYLHVPFCRTRCGYCDFNTYTASELDGFAATQYLRAVSQEIALAARVLGPEVPRIETVFIGGGTPTTLAAQQLGELVALLRDTWGLAEGAEITTEANPDSVDRAYLAELRRGGINRISLGMQSSREHVLRVLERSHTPGRGPLVASWAQQEGFEHVSLDLIYGTPGESIADWKASLEAVTGAPVDHVSAYSLIVEQGTRLALRVRKGEFAMPEDDELADKYLLAEEHLTGMGFTNYETSNWARPMGQCRHNLAYWRGGNWWGFGPGAHSHIGGVRFWNRKHPRSYAAALTEGKTPALGQELLTPEQRRMERVLLELRLAEGLDLAVLSPKEESRVAALVAEGLGELRQGRFVLSLRGRLLADGIALRLLA